MDLKPFSVFHSRSSIFSLTVYVIVGIPFPGIPLGLLNFPILQSLPLQNRSAIDWWMKLCNQLCGSDSSISRASRRTILVKIECLVDFFWAIFGTWWSPKSLFTIDAIAVHSSLFCCVTNEGAIEKFWNCWKRRHKEVNIIIRVEQNLILIGFLKIWCRKRRRKLSGKQQPPSWKDIVHDLRESFTDHFLSHSLSFKLNTCFKVKVKVKYCLSVG